MNAFRGSGAGVRSKRLVLTAMIFAVAMTFIDQTIVSPRSWHCAGSSGASKKSQKQPEPGSPIGLSARTRAPDSTPLSAKQCRRYPGARP